LIRNGIFKPGSQYHGYAAQADWQHTDGYIEILGLSNVLPRKVSAPTPERVARVWRRCSSERRGARVRRRDGYASVRSASAGVINLLGHEV